MILFALRRKKAGDYDIIHAQDILSGYTTKLFYKKKLPLVITCHFNDNPIEEDILMYRFGKEDKDYLSSLYKKNFSEVDDLIYHSKYSHEKSKHLLNPASKIKVIHNGVKFTANLPGKKHNEIFQIINVGYIEPRKNQTQLVSLAKELRDSGFKFKMTLVGDGPDVPLLKKLIRENGLEDAFLFTGWVDNVDKYLKNADLYIHTSVNDICPYSILEAISKNVPAIAFSVGGIPEMLDPEYLFTLNDYMGMKSFILQNHTNLDSICKLQIDKISEPFSIKNQLDCTRDLYLSMVKQHEPVSPVLKLYDIK
jgi:glycosyltransferase involved in cell wall biosynthesis